MELRRPVDHHGLTGHDRPQQVGDRRDRLIGRAEEDCQARVELDRAADGEVVEAYESHRSTGPVGRPGAAGEDSVEVAVERSVGSRCPTGIDRIRATVSGPTRR